MFCYKLTTNLIHLWYISLDIEIKLEKLVPFLSANELQKANSFLFEHLRYAYILRRGALRHILSQYCNIEPQSINFNYNNYQKPYLEPNNYNLQFNMSNSNKMAVLAITQKDLIGVDIEYLKPIDDIINIAHNFFSETEFKTLAEVPITQQLKAFYTIWTRKEALVKASGEGLSAYPVDTFNVAFLPTEPIKLIDINNSTHEADKWSLNGFTFEHSGGSYIAATVTKNTPKQMLSFYYEKEFNKFFL